MARKTHWIAVGAAKVGFVSEDHYSSIGPTVGVTVLADADKIDALSTVGNLFRTGQAIRLKVRYKTEDDEIKTSSIVCDIDKAASAIPALRGMAFKEGSTIQSASIPRRRRLG